MDNQNASEHAKALASLGASKGGKIRASRLSKEERQNIARKAAEARWDKEDEQKGISNIIRAKKYVGVLDLGGYKISCAVTDEGQRILVERSMANALGVKGSGAYWQRKKKSMHAQKGALLPEYVSARYLQPFVDKELKEKLENPVRYINQYNKLTIGVDASVLPDICDVWITAKEKGALNEDQIKIAERAYILMKGFAKVGIYALIDEVTNYQEIRDRIELQNILDKYLLPYKAAWAKRFPDSFYKAMFRLKKWPYDPKSVKRPSIVGWLTDHIVYSRLAPGILEELKARTPKDDKGRRKHRFHQLLTENIGHPKLQEILMKSEALMDGSANWAAFERSLQRALPELNHTIPMDIPEE